MTQTAIANLEDEIEKARDLVTLFRDLAEFIVLVTPQMPAERKQVFKNNIDKANQWLFRNQ